MLGYKQIHVDKQVKAWQQSRDNVVIKEESPLPFITISREYGCGGFDIATKLSEILNKTGSGDIPWAAYDRELLEKIISDMGISRTLAETLTASARNSLTNLLQTSFSSFPPQVAVFRKLAETVRILALNGHVIVVGRAGNRITSDMKGGYHVRLVASLDWKINRVSSMANISAGKARTLIHEKEAGRETFIREFVKFDVADPHNYDLVINNSNHTAEQAIPIILEGMRARGLLNK